MIKVSVIIPVYNVENYLAQCLDSVIYQTLKEIEIICVDDGSTDKSYEILQEYARRDKRIKLLQQKNAGAGTARNTGIKTAYGEYIHFLDADDYLTKDAYENLYNAAKFHDADFVKAKSYCFDNNTNERISNPYYELMVLHKNDFNNVHCFSDAPDKFCKVAVVPWNGIYKRTFLLQNNIEFNHLPCVNDRSFYNHVLICAKRFVFIDAYVVYYRTNNNNSLIGKRGQYFYCHFESYKIICNQCECLSPYEKATVLNTELTDLFLWYRRLKQSNQLPVEMQKQIKEFISALDIKEILNHQLYCEWYDTYCSILDERNKKKPVILKMFKQYQALGLRYCIDYIKKYGINSVILKIRERLF